VSLLHLENTSSDDLSSLLSLPELIRSVSS